MTQQSSDSDDFLLWLVGLPLAVTILPGILARYVTGAETLLLKYHVLVTDGVLIHVTDNAGLDLGRCAIGIGLILLALGCLALFIREKLRPRQR